MAEKTSAEVVIGGKVYTLSGYESEEPGGQLNISRREAV